MAQNKEQLEKKIETLTAELEESRKTNSQIRGYLTDAERQVNELSDTVKSREQVNKSLYDELERLKAQIESEKDPERQTIQFCTVQILDMLNSIRCIDTKIAVFKKVTKAMMNTGLESIQRYTEEIQDLIDERDEISHHHSDIKNHLKTL